MADMLTLADVLSNAVQREIDSQSLYKKLGSMVKEQAVKYAFSELVKEERGHQEILERYLRGGFQQGTLTAGHFVDFKIADKLDHPQISPEMSLKDTFLMAANREKLSHQFYTKLAKMHPSGDMKKLLMKLAAEELHYKQKV